MRIAVFIACGLFGLPALAASDPVASSPEELRAAKFHAEGLEVPLGYLREGAQLILACNVRFATECSDAQRQAADSKLLRTLDLITHIPTKASRVVVPAGHPEFLSALRMVSDDIVHETLEYDRKLLARFGAALRVCPPGDANEYRAYLAQMKELVFRTFGQFDDVTYARALASIDAEEVALAESFRREWTPAECTAAGDLGNVLMQHLYERLVPWNTEGEKPVGRDAMRGAAGGFLIGAALELEKRFRPEMKSELRALDGGAEAPRPRD